MAAEGITVIEQSTSERERETVELWRQVEPLVEDGMTLAHACQRVKGTSHANFYNQGWFRDLRAYGESRGYRPQR